MQAPAFWWRTTPNLAAQLLRPAALAYGALAARRMGRDGERAALPVLCVGNFTAGGAGKTPTALALAGLLRELGERPAFLSRGYGGRLPGPLQVGAGHEAADVGDEPLLLARAAPAFVSRDRPSGARLAAEVGATAIVMDDGLQNPSLVKDLALAVVDGETGIGNGLPLPAGPLRAPMAAQWPRVDAVIVVGGGSAGEAVAAEADRLGKPAFRARLLPDPGAAAGLAGRRVLAFAGIGRPRKFFDTLRACGAIVEAERAFADHHRFSAGEAEALIAEARARDLVLVTTEKDHARLGASPLANASAVLPVSLAVEDEGGLKRLLAARLGAARAT